MGRFSTGDKGKDDDGEQPTEAMDTGERQADDAAEAPEGSAGSDAWGAQSGESQAGHQDDGEQSAQGQEPAGEAQGESEQRNESRVSVVDEQPPRPAPPDGASEDEYEWHTYNVYPAGRC